MKVASSAVLSNINPTTIMKVASNESSSKFEWALGLHDYPSEVPAPKVFASFFGIVSDFLDNLSVAPTHIAAEGEGYSGKLTKFGGVVTKRLIESKFAHVTSLSIVVSPPDSKEPSFHRHIGASLTWTSPCELMVCFVANEAVVPFNGIQFDNLLRAFLEWRDWVFGFGFKDLVSRQPDFHVLTIDNGMLTKRERDSLLRWYGAKPDDRRVRLRDIYPVNILGSEQTARLIDGQTFGEVIRQMTGSTVTNVNNVTLWKVLESDLLRLRTELDAKGALIAAI